MGASESVNCGALNQVLELYTLLDTFPADERLCWSLRYIERFTLEEVALSAKLSLATVKRKVALAQGKVESRLGDDAEVVVGASLHSNAESTYIERPATDVGGSL